VAANLTVTAERQQQVDFTQPLEYSRETLAVASGSEVPQQGAPLVGTLGARVGTTLLATALDLAADNPDLAIVQVDSAVTNEQLLDRLAAGEFDFVVQDGNVLRTVLGYRNDIVAGPAVTEPRPLAWAVRPDNPGLLRSLNAFLTEYRLLGQAEPTYIADLPELRDRRRLRMITTNNAATYFLWRGELLGFEYELGKRFAEQLDLRLEVVVARDHDELLPMLLAGEGDFVAAFLVPTESRREQGVAFTRPYHYASEVIVGRADEQEITSLDDLTGRRIAVRRSSSYWTHVEDMIGAGELDAELVAAPPEMETQKIIDGVARGEYDLTVADSHILDIEMTWRDDVAGLISLGEERPHSWAVHPDNEALLDAMNTYLAETYRGLYYNLSYQKYFRNPRHAREDPAGLSAPGRLSPYDDLAKRFAAQYGFDWRLIIAQMYQESRFDPRASSWMGAKGLMQVLPRTGREFGFEDLEDPETGIHAGVRYLDWVRERFPRRLPPAERTWFALAAYNAGHGHVRDARRLAQRLGHDPDRWFGNVEYAMLKLSDPEYASQARHGYVRGSEPVKYVRSIRDRFRAYAQILD
jgi:membrane-bound lytic murein transglycosylase F